MSASDAGRRRYRPAVIEEAPSHPGSRAAYALATGLVGARWLIVAGWVGGAVAALFLLPPLTTRSGGISDITSTDNPAIVAETRAAGAFGFPVLSRTMLVQRDPAGLQQPVVQKAYQAARSLQEGGPQGGIAAALPVLDAAGIVPGSKQTGTTLVTFLYPQSSAFGTATRAAQAYAGTHFDRSGDHVVGVTGT